MAAYTMTLQNRTSHSKWEQFERHDIKQYKQFYQLLRYTMCSLFKWRWVYAQVSHAT